MWAWACTFPYIWLYSTAFCAQMLVNASLCQSALSSRKLQTVICTQTFRQDDPFPQKTNNSKHQTSYAISAVLYVRPQGCLWKLYCTKDKSEVSRIVELPSSMEVIIRLTKTYRILAPISVLKPNGDMLRIELSLDRPHWHRGSRRFEYLLSIWSMSKGHCTRERALESPTTTTMVNGTNRISQMIKSG